MVKTCSSDVGAWRLMPGWGASVPHVVGCGQKFKNKNKIKFMYQRIIEEEGERHAAEWREEEEEKKRYRDFFFLITSTWVFIFTRLILEAKRNPKWIGKSQIKFHIQSKRQEFMASAWLYHMKVGKEMAIDSNILAWEIPQTEESGGLYSMGSCKLSDKT